MAFMAFSCFFGLRTREKLRIQRWRSARNPKCNREAARGAKTDAKKLNHREKTNRENATGAKKDAKKKGINFLGQDDPESASLSLELRASHFFSVSSSVPSVISVVQLLRVFLRALRDFAVILGLPADRPRRVLRVSVADPEFFRRHSSKLKPLCFARW
jgi:hypothetical protein